MVANLGCGVDADDASLTEPPECGLPGRDLCSRFVRGGGFGPCGIIGTGAEIVMLWREAPLKFDGGLSSTDFDLKVGSLSPIFILLNGQLILDILSNLHNPETLGRNPDNLGMEGFPNFQLGIDGMFGIPGRDGIEGMSMSCSSINLDSAPLAL